MYQRMTQTTHAIKCLYHISRNTITASHSTFPKWDNNFDSTTGWIRIPTWIMQANDCVEIEKDIQLCEGLRHTNDGGSVVKSPLKSISQSSRVEQAPTMQHQLNAWVSMAHTFVIDHMPLSCSHWVATREGVIGHLLIHDKSWRSLLSTWPTDFDSHSRSMFLIALEIVGHTRSLGTTVVQLSTKAS